jgi:hypothetical protein
MAQQPPVTTFNGTVRVTSFYSGNTEPSKLT